MNQVIHSPFEPLPMIPQLAQPFLDKLSIKKCPDCGADFSNATILFYEHKCGWIVPGFEKRQWLYIECPKCGEGHSLWKLGVPRN